MSNRQEASGYEPDAKSFFDLWQTFYEKTAKPFLNIPQLGLMRYYQEHVFQSMDKFFQMQGAITEFAGLLFQPIDQSLRQSLWDAQNDLFASILSFSQDTQTNEKQETQLLYSNWIASMEKRYMELFRSPDYLKHLNNALDSLNGFIISRQMLLEDLLKSIPVPTHSELDGLYKEFYDLKKKVREMENRQAAN